MQSRLHSMNNNDEGKPCSLAGRSVRNWAACLLDQVGQGVAPELASGAETLGAARAVPVRTLGAEAAPAEHESLIASLRTLVCRQQSGRDLLYVAAAVAPWTGWSLDLLHGTPLTRELEWQVYACRSCPSYWGGK